MRGPTRKPPTRKQPPREQPTPREPGTWSEIIAELKTRRRDTLSKLDLAILRDHERLERELCRDDGAAGGR